MFYSLDPKRSTQNDSSKGVKQSTCIEEQISTSEMYMQGERKYHERKYKRMKFGLVHEIMKINT